MEDSPLLVLWSKIRSFAVLLVFDIPSIAELDCRLTALAFRGLQGRVGKRTLLDAVPGKGKGKSDGAFSSSAIYLVLMLVVHAYCQPYLPKRSRALNQLFAPKEGQTSCNTHHQAYPAAIPSPIDAERSSIRRFLRGFASCSALIRRCCPPANSQTPAEGGQTHLNLPVMGGRECLTDAVMAPTGIFAP